MKKHFAQCFNLVYDIVWEEQIDLIWILAFKAPIKAKSQNYTSQEYENRPS